jgi:predicted ferric reductase
MRYFAAAFWILLYQTLVLAPVLLLLVGALPPGNGFWVDAALAMGYAALAMMGIQFFLTARFRRASAPFGIDIIYYFHRIMAIVGFVLIAGHALLLPLAKPGLLSTLLSARMPPHAMAAWAALALFAALIATSIWRKPLGIPYEPWRRWHGLLSVAAVLLALVHVQLAGYYFHAPWKRALWTIIVLSWLLLLLYVRLLKPFLLLRKPYRVVSVHAEGGESWTLRLRPEGHRGFRFMPGQFAWLTLQHSPFSLNEHPFSIASSAEQAGEIAFTIKELGDFTREIGRTPIGARAYVDGPFGAFTPDYFPQAPGFVFIAGGVGIAPIMSMLRTLADRGEKRPVKLLYGSWTLDRVLFREELEGLKGRLNLEVVHVLQEPPADWHGECGLLTQEVLRRHLPPEARPFVYFICGPKPMLRLVEHGLFKTGVPLRNIQSELFDLV